MTLFKTKSTHIFSYFFYMLIMPVFAAWLIILCLGMSPSKTLSFSNLVNDLAWQQAIQGGKKRAVSFRFSQPPQKKVASVKQAHFLSGISGKTEVISDAIPVVKYKGSVVAAAGSYDLSALKHVSIGDIVRIVSADGKVLYFKVVKRRKVRRADSCDDLDAPKSDTTLYNCMHKKRKRTKASNAYTLELIPAPAPQYIEKRNAIMQHQS